MMVISSESCALFNIQWLALPISTENAAYSNSYLSFVVELFKSLKYWEYLTQHTICEDSQSFAYAQRSVAKAKESERA